VWLLPSQSVSQESKQQILQPLSVLRPKFRVSGLPDHPNLLM
jgi:hypothetical protein